MKQELINLLRACPFQPFAVHLSGGESYEVRHPEQAMLTDTGLYIAEGDKTHRCSLIHVTHLSVLESAEK